MSETKLLGVKLQENLKWNDRVKDVANASYGVLRTLRKLKHFTNVNLRTRLAELLVLSRLDYCDSVFLPLPRYLMKRLKKIEFAATSFVYGRYVDNIGDILRFQDTTAALFNNLPKELKICDNLNLFTSRLFKFLKKSRNGTPLEIFKLV